MFHTNYTSHAEKLSPEDAEVVDVIHTAGRWLGMDGVVSGVTQSRPRVIPRNNGALSAARVQF